MDNEGFTDAKDDGQDDFAKDIEEIDLDDDTIDIKTRQPMTSPINMKVVLIIVGVVLLCGLVIAGGVGGYFASIGGSGSSDPVSSCIAYSGSEPCSQKYGLWCINSTFICVPGPDGWLTWLRRVDASTSFNRTWLEYVKGFGHPDSNFWLGLEPLHLLTGRGSFFKLEIQLESWENEVEHITYQNFTVSNSSVKYKLSIGKYGGNSTDTKALEFVKGWGFSTWDGDNDELGQGNCAANRGGGWWFRECGYAFPTGRYERGKQGQQYMSWYKAFGEDYQSLKSISMRIKPSGIFG